MYAKQITLDIYGLIGYNIKRKRIEQGHTQQYFASICHIPRTSLSKFEAGVNKIPIDTLMAIAEKLNCEISELIKDEG